jgi:hypothetical protein
VKGFNRVRGIMDLDSEECEPFYKAPNKDGKQTMHDEEDVDMTIKENIDKIMERTNRDFINVFKYKKITFGNSEEEKELQERKSGKKRKITKEKKMELMEREREARRELPMSSDDRSDKNEE